MTIGVATMASNGAVVCAADRMLTRGVAQTEPEAAKIYHFKPGHPVTVMWAGSASVFAEVAQAYLARARVANLPHASVGDAVKSYCSCFAEFVGLRAEREILTKIGLTRVDLVGGKVSYRRAGQLLDLIFGYELDVPDCVETIFVGHDAAGSHIWRTFNATPVCCDVEGFAAIGTGAEHAVSHLGFSRHTPNAHIIAATVGAYFAKRRAEMAPGVGRVVDMALRMPGIDPINLSDDTPFVRALDTAYVAFAEAERANLRDAALRATAELQAILPTQPTPPDTPVPEVPEASTDGP
ncbi:MAG: hypothetical protein ACYC5V_04185 [Gemmatimonadaceae bacterium]